jgi:hypothetical protein
MQHVAVLYVPPYITYNMHTYIQSPGGEWGDFEKGLRAVREYRRNSRLVLEAKPGAQKGGVARGVWRARVRGQLLVVFFWRGFRRGRWEAGGVVGGALG